jgi:predicted transcriptional regulator
MTEAAIYRGGSDALDDIRRTFGLSETELAALCGVKRPSIAKWRLRGVPIERVADVDRVRELSGYFAQRFVAVRISQIVRTPGKGLRGKTVLAVIARSGVEPVYAYLERLFSYTA